MGGAFDKKCCGAGQQSDHRTFASFFRRSAIRTWVFGQELDRNAPGLVLDFGVREGSPTLQIAAAGHHVYGFDAFERIRDPWTKVNRGPGAMSLQGKIPSSLLDKPNISTASGWVEETLPAFLESHAGPIKLAHLDLDVYSPTEFVLDAIRDRLVPGSWLVFDDFFGHLGWENHSFKAFHSTLDASSFSVLAVSPQVVVFRKI